ncbi:hypothetical protein C7974DRAFT_376855 [Boeremia exigua]|uniref:uncharacterized protein n=1 Tax=Boeremia exigua TaxID=749465 RepID=UPI001E8D0A09|nr:uncharacterized protein C7974DRAFT_376855 [Boeremia exigua]KAH6625319.1 hypothetical protein C7974DRAFT_376855 [Boeremia exigua]
MHWPPKYLTVSLLLSDPLMTGCAPRVITILRRQRSSLTPVSTPSLNNGPTGNFQPFPQLTSYTENGKATRCLISSIREKFGLSKQRDSLTGIRRFGSMGHRVDAASVYHTSELR